jgi:hypothetical protein
MSEIPDGGRQTIGSTNDDRRSRLLGIKLRALVGEHLGRSVESEPEGFPHGAAFVDDGAAWVLVEGPAARSLGAALAWSVRQGATSLHLVVERDTGLLARRVQRFAFPITVWYPQERVLLPVVPEPLAGSPAPLPGHLEFVPVIEAAGATANVEHGIVVGEVRGLEVCRVVDQPTVGHFAELGDIDIAPHPEEVTGTASCSRSVSAPTTVRRSGCCTATSRRSRRSRRWSIRCSPTGRRTPSSTR